MERHSECNFILLKVMLHVICDGTLESMQMHRLSSFLKIVVFCLGICSASYPVGFCVYLFYLFAYFGCCFVFYRLQMMTTKTSSPLPL